MNLRAATAADAGPVADVYLASRRHFLPYAPLAHPEAEVRAWVAAVLIPSGGVQLAERAGQILGFSAVSHQHDGAWLDQLYLDPACCGQGLGGQLLAQALGRLPRPVRLYCFQANGGARRFYERHGFRPIAFGDGSDNEERCPDVLYELGAP